LGMGVDSEGEPAGHLLVETRLELAGLTATPYAEVSEPLRPGRPVLFQWEVRPDKSGEFQGTLWIYSRTVPGQSDQADPGSNRQVLSMQRIKLRVISLFGLSGASARILGIVGSALGLLVFLETKLAGFWKQDVV
jgi:hypothetical protein